MMMALCSAVVYNDMCTDVSISYMWLLAQVKVFCRLNLEHFACVRLGFCVFMCFFLAWLSLPVQSVA